jgi:hypothetical protein
MSFETAQKVADAVLYEGYVLYPYRASAVKNQLRWQFGVIVPRGYSEGGGTEPWATQTECLVDPENAPVLDLRIRFLQVQARRVEEAVGGQRGLFRPVSALEVDGQRLVTWDEGVERELDYFDIALAEVLEKEKTIVFDIPAGRNEELLRAARGRIVRELWPISGVLRARAELLGSAIKVQIRVENLSAWPEDAGADRNHALRQSLVGAHTLIRVRDGTFISLLEAPEWARAAAASCVNLHTWPVLVGEAQEHDVMLSSPIILYDYPRIAAESPGDLCDATEIDEILTLRTMTLTDEEKREARGTDTRAAAILDRIDQMPPEILERLHGAIRYLRAPRATASENTESPPWWDPGADASVSAETDSIQIGGVSVSRGSRVRLRPGCRRADAQDIFLDGRIATVEAVFLDVENKRYLGVTLADDPAAELHQWHGRFLYFSPDEVEPRAWECANEKRDDSKKTPDGE